MSAPESHPVYASDRALAIRYDVAPVTIWRWSRSGRIPPPQRLGPNLSRWNIAEVDAALAKAAQEEAGKKSAGWTAALEARKAKKAPDAPLAKESRAARMAPAAKGDA